LLRFRNRNHRVLPYLNKIKKTGRKNEIF